VRTHREHMLRHIHLRTHTQIHTRTHIQRTHTHTHAHTHTRICTRTPTYPHTCIHVCRMRVQQTLLIKNNAAQRVNLYALRTSMYVYIFYTHSCMFYVCAARAANIEGRSTVHAFRCIIHVHACICVLHAFMYVACLRRRGC